MFYFVFILFNKTFLSGTQKGCFRGHVPGDQTDQHFNLLHKYSLFNIYIYIRGKTY